MTTILIDHNIEGQSTMILGAFNKEGWSELFPLRLITLKDVGLSSESSDRDIWRFAQNNGMLLLTDNRNMKGNDSLEQTLREENTPTSLPVLTIGNVDRVIERQYREKCAARLAEIIYDLEKYRGANRLFIP
jgi:predicted nuclease of predicted toxin-antitoxin system